MKIKECLVLKLCKVDVKSPPIPTPDDRSQYLLPAFLCDFNWLIRTQELVWAKALLASEG